MLTKLTRKTWRKGRLKVVFDPEDEATPFMVYMASARSSQTYWCATGAGDIGGEPLSSNEMEWLDSLLPEIEKLDDALPPRE